MNKSNKNEKAQAPVEGDAQAHSRNEQGKDTPQPKVGQTTLSLFIGKSTKRNDDFDHIDNQVCVAASLEDAARELGDSFTSIKQFMEIGNDLSEVPVLFARKAGEVTNLYCQIEHLGNWCSYRSEIEDDRDFMEHETMLKKIRDTTDEIGEYIEVAYWIYSERIHEKKTL